MRQVISKDDKAVSPIIATILLIAITVVLAATLVTILGGFTKGASSSAASAGATTQFSNATKPNSVYINVSAFSVSGISSSKISFTVTIIGNLSGTPTGTPTITTTTLTGNLGTTTVTSSPSSTGTYKLTGPTTITGGSDYVISGYNGQINSVTVQLTYSGTVIYSSGTIT